MQWTIKYRELVDETNYNELYRIPLCDFGETMVRRDANFFVFNQNVYEVESTAYEKSTVIIYVVKDDESTTIAHPRFYDELGIEVRLLDEATGSSEALHFAPCPSQEHAAVLLGSDTFLSKEKHWTIDSYEVDQDRLLYVVYVTE
ncbi:MAG: hypothetical protein ACRCWQ_09355 [Bacilli bacterium]